MSLPFEFVVAGAPVSQQARRRQLVREWSDEVQRAARPRWGEAAPVGGDVMVAITYFFDGDSLDVDNMPKPILDALKDTIYADDAQVTDLLCRKRDIKEDPGIDSPSGILLETLVQGDQFLHVAVTNARSGGLTSW